MVSSRGTPHANPMRKETSILGEKIALASEGVKGSDRKKGTCGRERPLR